MVKYIFAFVIGLVLSVGVFSYTKAQTSTVTPTLMVEPTSVPAGAPATGYGTMK